MNHFIMLWSRYNILFESELKGYCLFNSRMLSLSQIDKETYELFLQIKEDSSKIGNLLSKEDYEGLVKNKVIVPDNEDDKYLSMLKYKKQMQSYGSKLLSLVVCPTLSCNFACPYCYEHYLPNATMKEDVQQQLVEFVNRHASNLDGLTLNWHGGEPLIAMDTIIQIYNKIKNEAKLPIKHSSMVSNGFLLTEENCLALRDMHLDYLQITIDGDRDTHNKTRVLKNGKSSFEQIIRNIDKAVELMPDCRIGIRTNIGKNNKEEYSALYHKLSERWKGKNLHVYHAFVMDNSMDTTWEKRQSLELSTEEKIDFEVMLANAGVKSAKSLFPKTDNIVCTCMDNNAYVVDPKGLLYKCWVDVGREERSIGSLMSEIKRYDIVSQFMTGSDKFSDTKCIGCSFLPVCDGGCNLYRVGKQEKGIDYDVCSMTPKGLVKILDTYLK